MRIRTYLARDSVTTTGSSLKSAGELMEGWATHQNPGTEGEDNQVNCWHF